MSERIGKYELLQEIGRGGMGIVYKAYDPALDRLVAIKVLPPEFTFDPNFVTRFLAEARAAAALEHPNVVTVHDVGEENEWHYFAMQFIDGGDLAALLRQRGRLELAEATKILQQVAEALDYAHERGIIHRDIKPENLLLDQRGDVHVGDFGIARAAEEPGGTRVTKTGMIVGTPEYMSPEQAGSGQPIDYRTDLYSLGIVAYEMLTGRPPFRAERDTDSPISVVLKHVQEVPAEPLTYNSALPPYVNHAIMKALQKNPSERFATTKEFMRAMTGEVQVGPQTVVVSPASRPVSSTPTVVTGLPPIPTVRPRSNRLTPAIILSAAILGAALLIVGVLRQTQGQPTGDNGNEQVDTPIDNGKDHEIPAPSPPPEEVTVPKLLNRTEEEASTLLVEQGLQIEVQKQHDTETAPGHILSQTPEGDTQAPKGTTVSVTVSLGPGIYQFKDMTASASSVLDNRARYHPRNLIDGTRQKAWNEGAPGPGIGEWVRLDFPQWRYVTRVGVIPGYVHTYPGYGDLFTVNNRLTAATLSFSNDEERDVTFEESKAMQYTDFDPPIYTNHVKLTIKGCRRGTYAKWNDTCISEMEVWGYDSQRGDQS